MALLKRLLTVLVAVLLIAVPASLAQGAPGGGGGGRPDGVGNRPDGVGNGRPDGAGTKKGDYYADLMVIARYENGVPMTIEYTVDPVEGEEETHVCVRPITDVNPGGLVQVPSEGSYPTFGYTEPGVPAEMFFIPLAGQDAPELELEPCDLAPDWTADETDLGRLNLARAKDHVLAKQLADVVSFLDVPEGVAIGLDASGRFTQVDVATCLDPVTPTIDATCDVIDTIDAPLGNLAAMQSILETGFVGGSMPSVLLSELELAAVQLGAAAPKEDAFEPTVDVVQYLGRLLNIPEDSDWSQVTPAIQGDNYLTPGVFETFLDFTTQPNPAFTYDRTEMFPGCIHYYDLTGQHASTLMDFVFGGDEAEATGIEAYTQLAADAREVLVVDHDLGITVLGIDDIRTTGSTYCSDAQIPTG